MSFLYRDFAKTLIEHYCPGTSIENVFVSTDRKGKEKLPKRKKLGELRAKLSLTSDTVLYFGVKNNNTDNVGDPKLQERSKEYEKYVIKMHEENEKKANTIRKVLAENKSAGDVAIREELKRLNINIKTVENGGSISLSDIEKELKELEDSNKFAKIVAPTSSCKALPTPEMCINMLRTCHPNTFEYFDVSVSDINWNMGKISKEYKSTKLEKDGREKSTATSSKTAGGSSFGIDLCVSPLAVTAAKIGGGLGWTSSSVFSEDSAKLHETNTCTSELSVTKEVVCQILSFK